MDILDRSVLAQALHLLVLAEMGLLFYFGACSSIQPLAYSVFSISCISFSGFPNICLLSSVNVTSLYSRLLMS